MAFDVRKGDSFKFLNIIFFFFSTIFVNFPNDTGTYSERKKRVCYLENERRERQEIPFSNFGNND